MVCRRMWPQVGTEKSDNSRSPSKALTIEAQIKRARSGVRSGNLRLISSPVAGRVTLKVTRKTVITCKG